MPKDSKNSYENSNSRGRELHNDRSSGRGWIVEKGGTNTPPKSSSNERPPSVKKNK